jgi:hypothetical protein
MYFDTDETWFYHSAYKTTDFQNFNLIDSDMPFAGREGFVLLEFNNALYIIGGYSDMQPPQYNLNDIWKSSDGETWSCVNQNPPFPPRRYPAYAVYDGYIWIAAGRNGSTIYKDVWRSADGINWEQMTDLPDYSILAEKSGPYS